MKRKLAFIMASIMLLTTPASVLASEGSDWTFESEETLEEPEEEVSVTFEEDMPSETDAVEAISEPDELSYGTPVYAEASKGEDYSYDEIVAIEDVASIEVYSADEDAIDNEGDVFIVSIEEVPITIDDEDILASGDCGDDLTWELDDEGTLTVSGSGTMWDWSDSSPAPWFYNRTSIDRIIIKDGVTVIGTYAFYALTHVTSVSLPESLIQVHDYAFLNCSNITSIIIPDQVVSVESEAFENCTSLKEIILPESLSYMGQGLFTNCTSLEQINLPDAISEISYLMFSNCSSLTSIDLSENIQRINARAFYNCTSLIEVGFPDSLQTICYEAFKGCSSLKSIELPNNLTSMEREVFANCSALINITLPASLTTIETSLFQNCCSLESIILPDYIISIGDCAFENCTALKNVTLPEYIVTIGASAFENCTSLNEINIPKGLMEIQDSAFRGCSSLKSLSLFNELTYIGEYAFYDCNQLSDVYYSGTQDDWGQINVKGHNDSLLYAIIHCDDGIILCDISECNIILSNTYYTYNGSEKTPLITVTTPDGNKTLINEKDYSVSFTDNINAGTATVTVYGEGNYTGSLSASFIIHSASLYDADITLSSYDYTYDGSEKKPEVTVKIGGKTIGSENYTVSYNNNINAGLATVKVVGKKNCTGLDYDYFDINEASLSEAKVTLSSSSYTYNGSAKKPSVTVKVGNRTLGTKDYDVYYYDNINAGEATVSIYGKGNYTDFIDKTFTIKKASQTLTAKASPSSIVKGNTAQITAQGTGEITYKSGNKSIATVSSTGKITAKAPGSVQIMVKAAGNSNYKSASKTLTIKVKPKATTLLSVTSNSSKKMTVKWKKVSGVTGYQIQYSTSKSFPSGSKTKSKTVSGASKVSKTISKLKKGKTYYVRIRTYKIVSGTAYCSSWTSKKKVKVK